MRRWRQGPVSLVELVAEFSRRIAPTSSVGRRSGSVMANKFFARVAVVGHCGIVDLEDAQGLRIMHPHGVGVGGKEQTIVLGGAPDSQELVLQQGHNHAESDKILGHIPQFRGNLPGLDQVVAK